MLELVPTFGIDTYAERVARLMTDAPREMPIVEGVVLAGLASVAGLLVIVALFRRSVVAAVGFSFLALVGLICTLLFGRLEFVPDSTQLLLLSLACCAMLLFLTATIRVARDNPVIGIIILAALAALLAIGGATGAGVVDGAPFVRLGVAATFGITLICILIEVIRRDRASLVVAPGLVAIMVSPLLMSMVAKSASGDWMLVAMPVMVLAAGAVYAAVSAMAVLAFAKPGDKADASYPKTPMMAPMPHPTPLMREVEADPHDQGRVPSRHRPAEQFASEVADPIENGPISAIDDHQAQHHQPVRHDYAATPTPQRGEPMPPAPVYDDVSEPVSAHWGRGETIAPARGPLVAPDEYVWDQLASTEAKVGTDFAAALSLPQGVVASPDILRDAIAAGSLSDFDDHILGGTQPVTGRFDVELATSAGGAVRLTGRRQVDHDGLLSRIEAVSEQLAAAPSTNAGGSRAGLAAAATPLTASRGKRGSSSAKPDLSMAFERGEIQAFFQPIVRLEDRVTVGFEALARWCQADGTIVEAQDFVPELIKKGKGMDLATTIIKQAARELAAWVGAEPGQGQFVAVNIAASDLPKDELSDIIEQTVKAFALPPGALVVELTEGRIQSSQSKALAAAKAVRRAGASLAIDDFGVGYSTISRLAKFNFDLIKTDRSLIADLSNKKARAFMKTLLATAHKQKSPVIAEGIEDEETAAMLAEMGCDFGQGYLFGRAEPLGAPVDDPHSDFSANSQDQGPASPVSGLR